MTSTHSKTCIKCGVEKDLSEFFAASKGGRENTCKECRQARKEEIRIYGPSKRPGPDIADLYSRWGVEK